ncbi:hypothetical protein Tco_1272318 [Tanacetum coccineum]
MSLELYHVPIALQLTMGVKYQSILLGRRENVPHRRRMAHKRPKGWDAISRLLFPGTRNGIEHIPYPYPKTTRSPIMPSRTESKLLSRGRNMDLFNLISAPNPTKVKTGTRPRAAHEVPLLTATASRVIDMEDTTVASGSLGTPSALEKSSLDFANENPPPLITERDRTEDQVQDGLSREIPPVENPTTTEDHAAFRPAQSTLGGKSLASTRLEAGSTVFTLATQETPADAKSVSDPDLLSSRKTATEIPTRNVATTEVQGQSFVESPKLGKSASFPSVDGSPGGIYQPEWGVTNNCRLDTPNAGRDMVDHIIPSGFEQEVKLLKKATAKIAKQDQRIQAREEEIKKLDQEIKSLRVVEAEVHGLQSQTKNLDALLEAKVDMKKAVEAKNAELTKELKSLREEKIKSAFEEFKKYEDDKVEQRCAEMDAHLDKLNCSESPELRQAFADVESAGLVKGMSEGLKHGIEHGKAGRDLAVIEAYDPEADSKYVKALQDLKDLKYPLVDQLEGLKDALMELIMTSLHLESDSGEDAP